jgi:hypothetical protein
MVTLALAPRRAARHYTVGILDAMIRRVLALADGRGRREHFEQNLLEFCKIYPAARGRALRPCALMVPPCQCALTVVAAVVAPVVPGATVGGAVAATSLVRTNTYSN